MNKCRASCFVQVLNSPVGEYRIPYAAHKWQKPEVPRNWRPETTITSDILAVEPDLLKDIELQSIVVDYLRKKSTGNTLPEDAPDPIRVAAEEANAENGEPVNSTPHVSRDPAA